MSWILVTGASSGIGLEYCRHLAALGHDIVMVARRVTLMERHARDLHNEYGVQVEVIGANLADRADIDIVARRLQSTQKPVSLLVNNAGYAVKRPFDSNDITTEVAALNVMVTAPFVLSHAAISAMKKRGRGAIINVGSIAANKAIGTYSVHKAWLAAFSLVLCEELQKTNITVTCVEPGTVLTDFWGDAQPVIAERAKAVVVLEPKQVVKCSLKALREGKAICIPGPTYKAINAISKVMPRSLLAKTGTYLTKKRFSLP